MRCARVSRTGVIVLVGMSLLVPANARLAGSKDPALRLSDVRVELRLSHVRVEPTDQNRVTRVVIEANGALPEPTSGLALNPPRIYLDFIGVLPLRTVEPVSPNAAVARIRVAEHSASPLVTRVVVDLIEESQYRIDASRRAQGRVVVLLGVASIAALRQPEGGPGRDRETRHQPSPAGTAPAQTQFVQRASAVLLRLQTLKPLLEAIDRRADSVPGDLSAAAKEFDEIAKLLSVLKPPQSQASTHALLLRTCTLGARAARLRESAAESQDAASGWDAASAAAGALLMLDRATGELTGK